MKKYSNILINILLTVTTTTSVYIILSDDINKHLKSFGYIILGISVIGVSILKRKQLRKSNT
jgi:hypothetical protein